jgi:hypothetical protein
MVNETTPPMGISLLQIPCIFFIFVIPNGYHWEKNLDKIKFRRVLYTILIAFRTMKLVVRSRHRKNGGGV